MSPDPAWYQDVSLPALLRGARGVYADAISAGLEAVGCGDIPRNGPFVIGAMARNRAPLSTVIASLGTSKQAAGQLVDTLVVRGYLDRAPDPDDRRRLVVSLTERGEVAASAIRTAVEQVDAELVEKVGETNVKHARAALGALAEIRRDRTRRATGD